MKKFLSIVALSCVVILGLSTPASATNDGPPPFPEGICDIVPSLPFCPDDPPPPSGNKLIVDLCTLDGQVVHLAFNQNGEGSLVSGHSSLDGEAVCSNVGPAGETGPQGERGRRGSQGEQGPVGPEGPVGPSGEDSVVPGPAGPAGPAGEDGRDGLNGSDGVDGSDGKDSTNPGPQGLAGDDGKDGADSVVAGPAGKDGLNAEATPTAVTPPVEVPLGELPRTGAAETLGLGAAGLALLGGGLWLRSMRRRTA